MANLQASEQNPTVSSSTHPPRAYISKVKQIAAITMFVFAAQTAVIPVQTLYAGCAESATKAVIAAGILGISLAVLDCWFLACSTTVASLAAAGAGTVGIVAAATALAAKGTLLAGAGGCLESWIWDKPSRPSPQSSR